MMNMAGFHSADEDPPAEPEEDVVLSTDVRFERIEDRFHRLDYQFEMLHNSFDALARRVSHLLDHLGQNPSQFDPSSLRSPSPEPPIWKKSDYKGDPVWDAAFELDRERRRGKEATESPWGAHAEKSDASTSTGLSAGLRSDKYDEKEDKEEQDAMEGDMEG